MTGMKKGTTISCSTCGATTPIVSNETTICLYCSAENNVPPEISTNVAQFEKLREKLAARASRSVQSVYDPEGILIPSLVICIVVTLIQTGFLCYWFYLLSTHNGSFSLGTIPIILGIYAIPIGMFYLFYFYYGVRKQARTAKLPFGEIDLSDGGKLVCPNCSAVAEKFFGVVHRCRSCSSEMLIPFLLVHDFERLHLQKIMALRKKFERKQQRPEIAAFILISTLFIFGFAMGYFTMSDSFSNDPNNFLPTALGSINFVSVCALFLLFFVVSLRDTVHMVFRLIFCIPFIVTPLFVIYGIFSELVASLK